MNPDFQEVLNKILAKTPEELNEQEKAFLRARSSYLKKAQLEEYAEVLAPKQPEVYVSKKERAKQENQTSDNTETVKQDATI